MADSYKKVNGRLINNRGEWVWNGETYEYVTGHSEWLPLVFKSDNDAKKFEYLEKVWKAEQIIKYSHNKQEVMLAKEWLRNNRAQHSDMLDSNDLAHWDKNFKIQDHKYLSRFIKNGKWRYVYGESEKANSKSGTTNKSDTPKVATDNSEWRNGNYYYNYNEKTGRISMSKDGKQRLKDLKNEAKKTKKDYERYQKLRDSGAYKLKNLYYEDKDGNDVRDPGKVGGYIRNQESMARAKDAAAYAQYKRNLRMAEEEKARLKEYRAECRKSARKEFVDSVADKGMSIINKLFKRK